MGSPGEAQLRISHNQAELVVSHLPPPPAGRIYEVWLKRGSTSPAPTSALFSVTADGAATVDVPGDLHGVSQVLVTQEPAGGSRVSTHSPADRRLAQLNAAGPGVIRRAGPARSSHRHQINWRHPMGLDNPIHIAFLLVILLLVFGAKRLPEMGRSLGSGLRGFKDSLTGDSRSRR